MDPAEAAEAEAAGSYAAAAPSESHTSGSGPAQESELQAGGASVNWGQATAQSPVSRGSKRCWV